MEITHINVPTPTVHEREPLQTFTGLFYANGSKIMKIYPAEPMGFIHFADPSDEDQFFPNAE